MEIFKKINSKQFFTLIELIVAIVVLGVLAAIVIPNISSFKEEAQETAIKADARNIQTAVDMFMLDYHGDTPTLEQPTLGNPQIVELYGLKPDYLRDLPKEGVAKFWLDENNTVWASKVDAPINVSYDNENQVLSWDTVDGASLYKVYKSESETTSKANASKLTHIKDIPVGAGGKQQTQLLPLDNGIYLVSALDMFDYESVPTGVGTNYQGYGEGASKDFNPHTPKNLKPTAVITLSPESDITTGTSITWGYDNSTIREDNEIILAEWKLNGEIKETMPNKLTEGTHNVELRIQDKDGTWSVWVSKELVVSKEEFSTATFTNASSIGRFGPTQSEVDSAYIGTTLEGKVSSSHGIQMWTIPTSGRYRIEAYGSRGGGNGGYGATLKGEFQLTQGQKLKILVGQTGTTGSGSGGGGGTFVVTSSNTPLIIAGGGGGGATRSISDASSGTIGKKGDGSSPGAGGSGGFGGKGATSTGNSGGGGFSGNGTKGTYDSQPGYGFTSGGNGGYGAISSERERGAGGFGGGGGANSGGHSGGGGGYSGGGASGNGGSGTGGGGGSYNAGLNQSNTSGSNSGNGKVIITFIE